MKTEDDRRLWGLIQPFLPDDPKAAIPFSHKLAAKQNEPPPFMEESPPPTGIGPPLKETTSSPPKLAWNIRNEVLTVVITLLTIPLVFIACFYRTVSPFSLNAAQFLAFFPLLIISCIISFMLLQLERGRSLIWTAIVDLVRRNVDQLYRSQLIFINQKQIV